MFERPGSGEQAVLVHLTTQGDHEDLLELEELAKSAGATPVATVLGSRRTPDPGFFIGKGKLEELAQVIEAHDAQLVLFNHSLSPAQERNLERELKTRVVDRNGLILDIFAQRAQSFEGKLQVELAQLKHLSTRLIRGWTHLERQKGGLGLRGPGETQLETDRRLIGIRIRQIQQKLSKVERQRQQGRRSRKRADIPTVSLVGYTNAGKSTLFNRLTGAETYAANQLFATLDPTLRQFSLAQGGKVILADTVGFIRHLPHELVAAFRSTLQEACEADLLLHVIDASNEDRENNIEQVNEVLAEIGAGDIPQIRVFNKIDLMDNMQPRRLDQDDAENGNSRPDQIWVSARSGDGLDLLDAALTDCFTTEHVRRRIHITAAQAGVRARLYSAGRVLSETADDLGGWIMEVELHRRNLGILAPLDSSAVEAMDSWH